MNRYKALEKQQEQTWAIASNLQAGLDQISMAVMNIEGIKAMEANASLMKNLMAKNDLTQERIDEIQDAAAETNQTLEELARIAAAPIGGQMDDFELDEEMALLQEELEDQEPAAAPPAAPARVVPAHVAPDPVIDDGLYELMGALS
jgi:uncharacterized membrane protein YkoI